MVQSPRFEEVEVGLDLPRLNKGPLNNALLMRWSSATENWHRIHYDAAFAKNHDKLPDILIHGSLKQQFLAQHLKDWAGREGWLWKLNFQFRAMNVVGEKLSVWASVREKRELADFGIIFLDLGIVNDHGKESTPGEAIVALPYLGGAPVPYPFPNIQLAEST